MLGDFLQHQAEQRLKVQYAYWDSELHYRWRGKEGEASVGREGRFKPLFNVNKNIR